MALSSTDPQQFADRIALVDTVMDVQSETIERLATEQASLTALEDHLSALRADSAEKKKQAEAALKRAQGARDAAAKAKADLDRLAASQAAQARTVARSAGRRQGPARHDAGRAGAAPEGPQAARRRGQAPCRGGAPGRRQEEEPVVGVVGLVGVEWELERLPQPPEHRLDQLGVRHALPPAAPGVEAAHGTRLRSPCGSVRAAASGTIIMAGDGGGYGNRVVIDHGLVSGDHLATTYNHLRSIRQWGGRVSRGEVIGYEGTTGSSTDATAETLEDGDFVDPRKYL